MGCGKSSEHSVASFINFYGINMNKDQVKGRVEQSSGTVKEAAGKLVGNDRLRTEGAAEKVKGKVQAGYGDAKEDAKDKVKKVIDKL